MPALASASDTRTLLAAKAGRALHRPSRASAFGAAFFAGYGLHLQRAKRLSHSALVDAGAFLTAAFYHAFVGPFDLKWGFADRTKDGNAPLSAFDHRLELADIVAILPVGEMRPDRKLRLAPSANDGHALAVIFRIYQALVFWVLETVARAAQNLNVFAHKAKLWVGGIVFNVVALQALVSAAQFAFANLGDDSLEERRHARWSPVVPFWLAFVPVNHAAIVPVGTGGFYG